VVPGEVSAHYAQQVSRASAAEAQWTQAFASYSAQHPELAAQFTRRMKGELPDEEQWAAKLPANPAVSRALSGADVLVRIHHGGCGGFERLVSQQLRFASFAWIGAIRLVR
jgi:transketolase